MREVRVESLEGFERRGGQVRLSANAGSLSLVFPEEVWKSTLARASGPEGPTPAELTALEEIRARLEDHAKENVFRTVLRNIRCGVDRSDPEYDLVLEPSGLLAATTGYLFAPVVGRELVAKGGGSGRVAPSSRRTLSGPSPTTRPLRAATRTPRSSPSGAAGAARAASRCRPSCGRSSRGASAGGTWTRTPEPPRRDSPCRS